MSRFDISKFLPPPDDELVCGICMNVLDDPMETPCRHVFCKVCINKALEENRKCPLCRTRFRERNLRGVLPLVQNMINKLTVRCDNFDDGCTKLIALEFYSDHEKICPYAEVPCDYSNCDVKVKRNELAIHRDSCVHKELICSEGCGLMVKLTDARNHSCLLALKDTISDMKNNTEALETKIFTMKSAIEGLQSQVDALQSRLEEFENDDDEVENDDDVVDNDDVQVADLITAYESGNNPEVSAVIDGYYDTWEQNVIDYNEDSDNPITPIDIYSAPLDESDNEEDASTSDITSTTAAPIASSSVSNSQNQGGSRIMRVTAPHSQNQGSSQIISFTSPQGASRFMRVKRPCPPSFNQFQDGERSQRKQFRCQTSSSSANSTDLERSRIQREMVDAWFTPRDSTTNQAIENEEDSDEWHDVEDHEHNDFNDQTVRRSTRLHRSDVSSPVLPQVRDVDVPVPAAYLLERYGNEDSSSDDESWTPEDDANNEEGDWS